MLSISCKVMWFIGMDGMDGIGGVNGVSRTIRTVIRSEAGHTCDASPAIPDEPGTYNH